MLVLRLMVVRFRQRVGVMGLIAAMALSMVSCVERKSFRTTPRQNENESEPPPNCDRATPRLGSRSLRLLTNGEYQRTVQDLAGIDRDVTQDFPREVRSRGMENVTEASVVTDAHAAAYIKAAEVVALKVSANTKQFVSCDGVSGEDNCAQKFIEIFGKKAFRGPLDQGEKSRLFDVYTEARRRTGTFSGGIDWTVRAMLMSPRFLYRFEIGEAKGDIYELTPWEVAQALSYSFWGTMPDDRLMELAEKGEIKKPTVLAEETRRLLESPRSRGILGEFAARWLGADGVLAVNKDSGKFPQFQGSLREKFLKETKDFFATLVLDRNATFETLFDADFTVGDDDIAQFYGGKRDGQVVRLPSKERVGLLGHASVLSAFADAEESHPVKRGLFALERILCRHIPPPPASLNVMPPPRDPKATTRERFAAHSSNDACSSCHVQIDGAGFGFEDMDAIGRFRSMEAGRKVDASGVILGSNGDKRTFQGTAELGRLISKNTDAQGCFVKQTIRYFSGREEKKSDFCAGEDLSGQFAAEGLNLKKLFLALPQQESFLKRRP